jgi:anti-sigma B factor antagonist
MSFFYIISNDTVVDDMGLGDVALLAMGGEIDYDASPQLKERIADHIKAGRRRLVLDISAATFIDSTAIGVLVGAVARLREAGDGSLAIVCADENESVLRIFQITGVENMIELYRSREEALSALALAG